MGVEKGMMRSEGDEGGDGVFGRVLIHRELKRAGEVAGVMVLFRLIGGGGGGGGGGREGGRRGGGGHVLQNLVELEVGE